MSSDSKDEDANEKPVTSRRSLTLATAVGACAVAAAATVPAIVLVLAPLRGAKSAGRWVRTMKLDQLKEGEPRRVAIVDDRKDAWAIERGVDLGSVWLVRHGNEVVAFSAVCPHLGCSVNAITNGFSCPCHTSAFDPSGKRISGPSPRDLDTLQAKVEDGHVVVDFRRFRIGIEQKVET